MNIKMFLFFPFFLFLLLSFSPAEAFDFHCGKNHVEMDIKYLVHIKESHENFQFNKKGEIIGLQIQVYLFFEDEYGWHDVVEKITNKVKCEYWCPGCISGDCPLKSDIEVLKKAVELSIKYIEGKGEKFSEREETPVLFHLKKALKTTQ